MQLIRNNPYTQCPIAAKTERQITEGSLRKANILRIESPLITCRRRFKQVNGKCTEQPAENPPPVLRIQALNVKAMVVNHLLLLST